MAEVFLATQLGAGGFERPVALKRILPHLCKDEETVTMFRDEALLAAHLSHPNIVQVYDLMEDDDGAMLIAMEWIAGKDLRRITKRASTQGPSLTPIRALVIANAVARALAHAHAARGGDGEPLGLVHRDVTPHNVMLTYDGEVKLTDFGIAKAAQRSVHTATGMIKGKVAYMSPEQARGEPVDARCDVFALGIVLWELLTGRRLFVGASDLAILRAVQEQAIPLPGSIRAEIPEALDALVGAALTRDLEARLPGAEHFATEAGAILLAEARHPEALALAPWMHALYPAEAAGQRAGTARHPATADSAAALPEISLSSFSEERCDRTSRPTTRPDRPEPHPNPAGPPRPGPGPVASPAMASTETLEAAALAVTSPARAGVGRRLLSFAAALLVLGAISAAFTWQADLFRKETKTTPTPRLNASRGTEAPVSPAAGPVAPTLSLPAEPSTDRPEETAAPESSAPRPHAPAPAKRAPHRRTARRRTPGPRDRTPHNSPTAAPKAEAEAPARPPREARGGTRMLSRVPHPGAKGMGPEIVLPRGTRLEARLVDSARSGTSVQLELTRSVSRGPRVLLPRGTRLRADVRREGDRLLLKIVEVQRHGLASLPMVARVLDLTGHPGLLAKDPTSPDAPLLLAPGTRLRIEMLAPLSL